MQNNFQFFKHMDSMGYDMIFVGKKPVEELMVLSINYKKCIGFNTLGYLKFNLNHPNDFKKLTVYTEETDGLYINKKRYQKQLDKQKHKTYTNFDDYIFYRNKDSADNDIRYVSTKSLEELKQIADSDPKCAGFNTLGFLKSDIRPESQFIGLLPNSPVEGLYVKRTKFRVKMICNWTSSHALCLDWNRMSKGNFRWNNIEITWEDNNVDFYVIINKPSGNEFYKPERTIVFHMEPWCPNPGQNWGVKTWGIWAEPDEEKFLQVRSHKNYYNNCFWQLAATYNDLKTTPIVKTKLMSSICSSKYFDPGHVKRIDFLKFIESKDDDVVKVDIYNTDNVHNFKGYVGPHPPGLKDVGITPYKYYFMPENNEEHNFMTEKIWEPLLTETLSFYWGCPNISEYIDSRAFIQLDLDDFEGSFNIIKNAIMNNEWEKRLEYIRMEKQKVLEYFNFFPTIERVLVNQFKFNRRPNDNDILYHKNFYKTLNTVQNIVLFINYKGIEVNINNKNVSNVYYFNYDGIKNYNNIKSSNPIELIKIWANYNRSSKILYINSDNQDDINFMVSNINTCCDLLNVYDNVKHLNESIDWFTNSYFTNANTNVYIISDKSNLVDLYKLDNKTRVKCVNLERRKDRKDNMIKLLDKSGLLEHCDFFSAVDGQQLQRSEYLEKLFKNNDFGSRRGVIGCALSHLKLWNNLVADQTYDNYLVLEDDIDINDNILFSLNQTFRNLPNDWDIIYLGFHMFKKNVQIYNKKIEPIKMYSVIEYDTALTIGGTFGYVINKSGAKKFIDYIKDNGIKHGIDYLMFKFYKDMDLKQYEVVPRLIQSDFVEISDQVDSDIQYDKNSLF